MSHVFALEFQVARPMMWMPVFLGQTWLYPANNRALLLLKTWLQPCPYQRCSATACLADPSPLRQGVATGPDMAAAVPLPTPGTYVVQLFFMELLQPPSISTRAVLVGDRVFDIYVQGQLVLPSFDILSYAEDYDRSFSLSFLARPPPLQAFSTTCQQLKPSLSCKASLCCPAETP